MKLLAAAMLNIAILKDGAQVSLPQTQYQFCEVLQIRARFS